MNPLSTCGLAFLLPLICLNGVAAHAESGESQQPALSCLAEAIYFETRGTGDEGGLAVAHVILNRQKNPEFPSTICGVVNDGCQFSYRCDGEPEILKNATERDRAFRIARLVLPGTSPDPTDGALFFHSKSLEPGWFATRQRIGEIGGNVFYR